MNSRFDFAGIDSNDKPFVMEIKNVPLADYVDVHKKIEKNMIVRIFLLMKKFIFSRWI